MDLPPKTTAPRMAMSCRTSFPRNHSTFPATFTMSWKTPEQGLDGKWNFLRLYSRPLCSIWGKHWQGRNCFEFTSQIPSHSNFVWAAAPCVCVLLLIGMESPVCARNLAGFCAVLSVAVQASWKNWQKRSVSSLSAKCQMSKVRPGPCECVCVNKYKVNWSE